MNKKDFKIAIKQQQNELNEHHVYSNLSKFCKNKKNKKILNDISKDELKHYNVWKSITKKELKSQKKIIYKYIFFAKTLGLSFALKLMERGEEHAQKFYNKMSSRFTQINQIQKDEEEHEKKLINILEDDKLKYAGAIVLGLNDALVEFTGTLAGLTLAFSNSTIIGSMGIIMGIAASLSMASSGYLSSKEQENNEESPIKSAIYTGFAYIFTVIFLVIPYFIFTNVFHALFTMLLITILIIASYTFYISIAKEISFKKRFIEMAIISLGVAIISYGVGFLIKQIFGLEI